MKKHKCEPDYYCCCNTIGLEPDEDCPIHGFGHYIPHCIMCGRFISKMVLKKYILLKYFT
jgi:hypothetical protein